MMAAAQVNVTGDFHFSSSEDEDSAAVPPPPPDIDTENIATFEGAAAEGRKDASAKRKEGDDKEDGEGSPQKKKKKKSKSQVLNVEKLLHESRGINYVSKNFPNLPLSRKKGHEVQDFNLLMNSYTTWADTLFGKYTFQDFVEKVEELGQKKPVQDYMHGLRRTYEAKVESANLDNVDGVSSDGEGEEDTTAVFDDGAAGQTDSDNDDDGMDAHAPPPPPPEHSAVAETTNDVTATAATLKEQRLARVARQKALFLAKMEEKQRAAQEQDTHASRPTETEEDSDDGDLPPPLSADPPMHASTASNDDNSDSENDLPPPLSTDPPTHAEAPDDADGDGDDEVHPPLPQEPPTA